MKKNIFKNILFLFCLAAGINFSALVFAEMAKPEDIIKRTVVEYKSGDLTDPFKKLIFKDEDQDANLNAGLDKPDVSFGSFQVQGIIWGGRIPQAIINNKVLTVGDLIDKAEILSIDKNGVTLVSSGVIGNLAAPGRDANVKQLNREDK